MQRRGKSKPKKLARARPSTRSFAEAHQQMSDAVKRYFAEAGMREHTEQLKRYSDLAEVGRASPAMVTAPTPRYQPCRDIEQLKARKTLSQKIAGEELGITSRRVRTLFKNKKLTRTKSGRVVVDDSFEAEFNSRHAVAK